MVPRSRYLGTEIQGPSLYQDFGTNKLVTRSWYRILVPKSDSLSKFAVFYRLNGFGVNEFCAMSRPPCEWCLEYQAWTRLMLISNSHFSRHWVASLRTCLQFHACLFADPHISRSLAQWSWSGAPCHPSQTYLIPEAAFIHE